MFWRKKKNEIKEEAKKTFIIPQFEKDIIGLKRKQEEFVRSSYVSPIFGNNVKNETVVPKTKGLSDVKKAYDTYRDKPLMSDEEMTKVNGTKYYEFTNIITNKTKKAIFGLEDVNYLEEEPKVEVKDDFSLPFDLETKIPKPRMKPLKGEIKTSDFKFSFNQEPHNDSYDKLSEDSGLSFIFKQDDSKQNNNFDSKQNDNYNFDSKQNNNYNFNSKQNDNFNLAMNESKEASFEEIFKPQETRKYDEIPKEEINSYEEASQEFSNFNQEKIPYQLPPTSIFKKRELNCQAKSAWVDEHIASINQTLKEFDIDGVVENFTQGPTVTRYEVKLMPGVNVKKIANIQDNLKMNLAVKTLRIEAPIPGKPTVGLEVPNLVAETVCFGNIVDCDEFKNDPRPLKIALGLDIDGKAIYSDIAKMPHGLVAGATNSGKSVCINTILVSLLLRNRPDELRLILIDPKMVELIAYNDLPHLITPVITDVKLASEALKWTVEEMERRYAKFANNRVRDIKSYNDKFSNDKMSYIVVVIDELADLMMMVASSDVEDAIKRLTQKARGAGIHLLVATQRPTTDVIKGTIKANIPTRIAFKVASFTDSITILDGAGADNLLGRGDMLIKESDTPVRVQGALISDQEIDAITDFVRSQAKENYIFTHEALSSPISDEKYDDLLADIMRFVVLEKTCSINRIQKEFSLGFNRAQKIVETLESLGVVSHSVNGRAREVLLNVNQLDEFLRGVK